jgi:hypothetical protein
MILHLMTQREQSYGSERRCCEECGLTMCPPPAGHKWTDRPDVYQAPPEGFEKCDWRKIQAPVPQDPPPRNVNPAVEIVAEKGSLSSEALGALLFEGGHRDAPAAARIVWEAIHAAELTIGKGGVVSLTALEESRRDPRPLDVVERLREALAEWERSSSAEHIIPSCAEILAQRVQALLERLEETS